MGRRQPLAVRGSERACRGERVAKPPAAQPPATPRCPPSPLLPSDGRGSGRLSTLQKALPSRDWHSGGAVPARIKCRCQPWMLSRTGVLALRRKGAGPLGRTSCSNRVWICRANP